MASLLELRSMLWAIPTESRILVGSCITLRIWSVYDLMSARKDSCIRWKVKALSIFFANYSYYNIYIYISVFQIYLIVFSTLVLLRFDLHHLFFGDIASLQTNHWLDQEMAQSWSTFLWSIEALHTNTHRFGMIWTCLIWRCPYPMFSHHPVWAIKLSHTRYPNSL